MSLQAFLQRLADTSPDIASDDADAAEPPEASVPHVPDSPRIWHASGAFHPLDRGMAAGAAHIVLRVDLDRGRLHRRAGDALCRPARTFWQLGASRDEPDCKRCLEIARRIGLIDGEDKMATAKTIVVTAKCADLCSIQALDEAGATIRTHDGYVPDWFPDGGGDYVSLEIDAETGLIRNWQKPTAADIRKLNGR